MNRILVLAISVLFLSCSADSKTSNVAKKKKEKAASSDAKTKEKKSKPIRKKSSLGIDPSKGINGPLVKEDYSTVGQVKNRKRKPDPSKNRTKLPGSVEEVFANEPKKVSGPPKVETTKKFETGKQSGAADEDQSLDFDVKGLADKYESDPESLRGKQIYVRGLADQSGVVKYKNRFVPTITLSSKKEGSTDNNKGPVPISQTCIFQGVHNLFLCELDRTVVIRGVLDEDSKTLVQCKLIAGSGPMLPKLDAVALAKQLETDNGTIKKALQNRQVLLKGTVDKVDGKTKVGEYDTPVSITGVDGLSFGVHASPEIRTQQFADLKSGQTIAIIGRFVHVEAKSPGSLKFAIRNASRIDLISK